MSAIDPAGPIPFGPLLIDGRRFTVRRVWFWQVNDVILAHGGSGMIGRLRPASWRGLLRAASSWLRPEVALPRPAPEAHPDEAAFEPGKGWGSIPPRERSAAP